MLISFFIVPWRGVRMSRCFYFKDTCSCIDTNCMQPVCSLCICFQCDSINLASVARSVLWGFQRVAQLPVLAEVAGLPEEEHAWLWPGEEGAEPFGAVPEARSGKRQWASFPSFFLFSQAVWYHRDLCGVHSLTLILIVSNIMRLTNYYFFNLWMRLQVLCEQYSAV